FRIIQIDPETLAIHVNAGAVATHRDSDSYFHLLDRIYILGVEDAVSEALHVGAGLNLLEFGASFLHELRHFADLLLTPFGFYRIRTAFEFYINFPRLLFSDKSKIPVPLMSGMDPITRRVIGLDHQFEGSTAHQMLRTAFSRVRVINIENEYDDVVGDAKVGGDRILEGLAYLAQFEFLFQQHNTSRVRKWFRPFFTY